MLRHLLTCRSSCTLLAALLFCNLPAYAQSGPEETVRTHFENILAEEYVEADTYFSREFRSAFRADVAHMNAYYLTRREQLSRGWEIVAVDDLDDGERETVRVTVDFADAETEDELDITERIYYYLVRQNSTDSDAFEGKAWRIDIFDALRYDSLADARRRPYLRSGEEWDEFASRELIARQGLFRIQMALESFARENQGAYPLRLLGTDNRRDELISSNKLGATYPENGFSDRPMRSVHFEEKSSGDFSYYSVDEDGDTINEGYWLLLHGRDENNFYFEGLDTIYILSDAVGMTQAEQAAAFALFWERRDGTAPVLTEVTEFMQPEIIISGPIDGAPVRPSIEQITESISSADPVAGIVEQAAQSLEESGGTRESSIAEDSADSFDRQAYASSGRAVGSWIQRWSADRLAFFFGPPGPADPMDAIEVEAPLTIHSFGSWE